LKCVTILVHASRAIQKVVRIISTGTPANPAARPNIALSSRCPRAELQILVAAKFRSAPNSVNAHQRIAAKRRRITIRHDRPDPEVLVEVVRDTTGEQI